jgi:non-structural maintenance of chromosomes element 1
MSQSGSYDNTHRAFLQALIARSTLTFAESKPLLSLIQTSHNPDRPVLEEDITRTDFEQYVHAVNNAISAFDMEIRSTAHQSNRGVEVFALVNTASDALTQMATVHSADEIAFVKRVLDCMFETNNTRRAEVMAVTGQQALNLAKVQDNNRRESGAATQETQTQAINPQNASLTMFQAEKTLRLLVSESWFEVSDKGFYTLSPRALMELRGWLIDTYNDRDNDSDDSDEGHPHEKIKVCMACREIVTQGQRCPDPTLRCPARLHVHCVGKMWRAQGGREICPTCKKEWKEPLPVGERAARRSRQSGSMGGRRSGVSGLDGADGSD